MLDKKLYAFDPVFSSVVSKKKVSALKFKATIISLYSCVCKYCKTFLVYYRVRKQHDLSFIFLILINHHIFLCKVIHLPLFVELHYADNNLST